MQVRVLYFDDCPNWQLARQRLDEALAAPVWQLSLGRKAFVPSEPVRPVGVGPGRRWWWVDLVASLRDYRRRGGRLRVVLDAAAGDETRQDIPVDFAARRFGTRHVQTDWLEPGNAEVTDVSVSSDPQST